MMIATRMHENHASMMSVRIHSCPTATASAGTASDKAAMLMAVVAAGSTMGDPGYFVVGIGGSDRIFWLLA